MSSATQVLPISANVEATRTDTRSSRPYTVFVVLVKCETGSLSWMVNRRFQEFAELNNSLSKKFSTLPFFPKKTWFFNMDAAFVEERREALNHYCSTIVRMRAVLLCPELQEFLELGTHGVNISDATQPFASTVLSDPKFGVNDVVYDEVDGVVVSACEDTRTLSRLDSYLSNIRLPWEDMGAMVPVGSINVWKRDENSEWSVTACAYFECQATCCAYDAERRYVFVGLDNGFVHIYRASERFTELNLISHIPLHKMRVSKLVYIPNKDLLISAGRDGYLSMYDVGGCRLVTSTEVKQARLMSLVYDGEGERVLVGTDKNELVLLDIRGNMFRVLKTLSGHSGTVRSLEFVAEAMLLISGGERTCIAWNMCKRGQAVSRCRPLAAFRGGPQSSVRSVMYCRNQKEVLSGCDNGMIAVWNTKSATVKLVLHGHDAQVTFMRWLGDNQFLTASRDGTIKFWRRPRSKKGIVQRAAVPIDSKSDDEEDSMLNSYLMHTSEADGTQMRPMRSISPTMDGDPRQ